MLVQPFLNLFWGSVGSEMRRCCPDVSNSILFSWRQAKCTARNFEPTLTKKQIWLSEYLQVYYLFIISFYSDEAGMHSDIVVCDISKVSGEIWYSGPNFKLLNSYKNRVFFMVFSVVLYCWLSRIGVTGILLVSA